MNIKDLGIGWFDLTDYIGNTVRFHVAPNSDDGATETGAVISTSLFSDYKADPGNGGLVPSIIRMIDTTGDNQAATRSTIITKVINGVFGGYNAFGNGEPTMIALGYESHYGPVSATYTNFLDTGTAHSISNTSWTNIGSNTFFQYSGATKPTGDGFNNTSIDTAISTRTKVLVMQNCPVKINNTKTTKNLGVRYYDGNTPISYGESFTNSLFLPGEEPGTLVGGKCEMIKAYYPFNSQTGMRTGQNPLNTVTGTDNSDTSTHIPVATLGSGAAHINPDNLKILTDSVLRYGQSWSGDTPEE